MALREQRMGTKVSRRSKILMLAGVTRKNRHQITADINDAVMGVGGWIKSHTLFSNIATTFHFALPPDRLSTLRERMVELGVRLDEESIAKLDAVSRESGSRADEIAASLNLTFIHTEPDLRRDVPHVPG
ncbi:hypothetical protein [Breoghania sp.]|uniref:hypothetical protein n=1 Tax=Breoghania sp. TaxID=2065378 RepID=UPI002AA906B6|nr:hypothetical protein [Breoghania sp.]